MDTLKNNTIPTITKKEWLQESIEEHFQCLLCGTPLSFQHKTDFVTGVVTEDAHCPACRVQHRKTDHVLQ